MSSEADFFEKNRVSWNRRAALHLESEFYDLPGFLDGKNSLRSIELGLLGDIRGRSILHLQCHFGQDTLSLARMGAAVTGVDLADEAISAGRRLAEQTGLPARFICCNVYDLPQHLNEQFDIVFTSYGAIGWLPDLDRWAAIVDRFLKPGGQFIFVEFHPVVWMFDDDFTRIQYRYFKSAPIVETASGSYAAPDADEQLESVSWNHGISEVFGSLLRRGLEITHFEEFDYSPYDCFKHTQKVGEQQFRILHLEDKIPMTYALIARKRRGDQAGQ